MELQPQRCGSSRDDAMKSRRETKILRICGMETKITSSHEAHKKTA